MKEGRKYKSKATNFVCRCLMFCIISILAESAWAQSNTREFDDLPECIKNLDTIQIMYPDPGEVKLITQLNVLKELMAEAVLKQNYDKSETGKIHLTLVINKQNEVCLSGISRKNISYVNREEFDAAISRTVWRGISRNNAPVNCFAYISLKISRGRLILTELPL